MEQLDAEAGRVRELYAEGIVRVAWSRGDVLGGVLFLEAPDVAAADRALASLPLVSHGMAELTTIELRPYRGFVPQD